MHTIRIDPIKNRLYLALGHFSDKEAIQHFETDLLREVKRLRQGFTCVCDLREFRLEKTIKDTFMKEIQLILWDSGIRAVARISMIQKAKGHFSYENASLVWPGYDILSATSLEEAEKSLDSLNAS